MTDFQTLLPLLATQDIRFILVGGMAAIFHGSARVTYDLDIVYARSNDNLERLVEALKPYEPYLRGAPQGLPFKWDIRTLKNGLNFTLTTSIGDIDIFGEILGGGIYEELLPHTVEASGFGVKFRCATLIKPQKAAGRPRDLEAIAELESLLQ